MHHDDEINAKLMASLLKKMGAHLYVKVRDRLVSVGVDEPLIMKALISEMEYISNFHNGSTLVVRHPPGDETECWVVEGALIGPEDREVG